MQLLSVICRVVERIRELSGLSRRGPKPGAAIHHPGGISIARCGLESVAYVAGHEESRLGFSWKHVSQGYD